VNILVISLPRTGSTVLSKSISSYYNIPLYLEPFNDTIENQVSYDSLINKKNKVVKTMIHHRPNGILHDFMDEFCFSFDKVILLSRRKLNDACLSWNYNIINKKLSNQWHEKYHIENESEYTNHQTNSFFERISKKLNEISDRIEIPIVYYEDLYSGNEILVKKTLSIMLDNSNIYEYIKDIIHPSKKYRQFCNPTII
jgi:hypothetical protein